MTVQKHRAGVRKTRKIRHGRKIARLSIGPSSDMFVVHEDLLCVNSPFFRQELQPQRKAVESECPICHEAMGHGVKELTFCQSCGSNFHHHCISQWEARGTEEQRQGCPLCRQDFGTHGIEQVKTFRTLDVPSFETYTEWIYRDCVTYTQEDLDNDIFNKLIKTYLFGTAVRDLLFRDTVMEILIEVAVEKDWIPSKEQIKEVYRRTMIPSSLRKLMVELYASAYADEFDDLESWKGLPVTFTRDLAINLRSKIDVKGDDWDSEKIKVKLGLRRT